MQATTTPNESLLLSPDEAPIRTALNADAIPRNWKYIQASAYMSTPEHVNLLQLGTFFSAENAPDYPNPDKDWITTQADMLELWRGPFWGRTYTDIVGTAYPADADHTTGERDSGTGWAFPDDQVQYDIHATGGAVTAWDGDNYAQNLGVPTTVGTSSDTRSGEESGNARQIDMRAALGSLITFDPDWFDEVSPGIPITLQKDRFPYSINSPATGDWYVTDSTGTASAPQTGESIAWTIATGAGNVLNPCRHDRIWFKTYNPAMITIVWKAEGLDGGLDSAAIYQIEQIVFLEAGGYMQFPDPITTPTIGSSGYIFSDIFPFALINTTLPAWLSANDPAGIIVPAL